tara:strand:+ start:563 stop:823 length:261 start_codon:yes stop_codon:yes gene_type:complete
MSNKRKVVSTTNISINLDKFPKEKIVKGEKGSYANITILNFDSDDEYGKNSTAVVSKTKEEREGDTATIYLGNGWYNKKEEDENPF